MGGTIRYPKAFLGIIWALFLLSSYQAIAKSRVPISDSEIRQKKNECYADIESGLWGQQCKSSVIAKENCALQCLSPVCYELIYESDPLEEGEKDYVRSSEYTSRPRGISRDALVEVRVSWSGHPHQKKKKRSSEYKYCMHRVSLGETLDNIKGSFDF